MYITSAWGFRRCSFWQIGQCESLTQWNEHPDWLPAFFVCVYKIHLPQPTKGAIGRTFYIMKDIKLPIVELGNGGFQVDVDLNLYSKEAITLALYKYTDNFFIHQQTSNSSNIISIVFEIKDTSAPVEIGTFKQFCNDLIDQQVRAQVEAQFGHIRDLIVEEAFKPVNK